MDQKNDSAEGFSRTGVVSWTGRGTVFHRRYTAEQPSEVNSGPEFDAEGYADKPGDMSRLTAPWTGAVQK